MRGRKKDCGLGGITSRSMEVPVCVLAVSRLRRGVLSLLVVTANRTTRSHRSRLRNRPSHAGVLGARKQRPRAMAGEAELDVHGFWRL